MKLFDAFRRSADKRRAYAELSRLDDHLLRDIGVSRAEIKSLMHSRIKANRSDV